MTSKEYVSIERGLGGDFQVEIKKRTGLDLKGISDPDDLLILIELEELVKKRKLSEDLKDIFYRSRRRIYADQYKKLRGGLQDDISKLSSALGHRDTGDRKDPLSEILGV